VAVTASIPTLIALTVELVLMPVTRGKSAHRANARSLVRLDLSIVAAIASILRSTAHTVDNVPNPAKTVRSVKMDNANSPANKV
jgi:hypothetical protein